MALSLCLLLCAAPLQAAAVKQEDIDALKAKRDAIQAQRLEKQAVVDRLEADQANVLEQKRALDERNLYTFQQIQLNDEEIALYDEMIAAKEEELLGAQKLEKEQLERYRARVRAMEENGTLNYLAMILKANNLGELLSAIDDIGEIMQSDRKLEDAYIEARENTEEVKTEYEEYRAEINGKQDALRKEKMQLEAELEEASQLLLSIQQDLENRQAEYDAIMAEEERTEAAIDKLVAQLEAERQVAAREGYDINIVRADMTEPLPFADASFDLVINPVSLCYVREVEPIWREVARVLRPGGVLLAGLDTGLNYVVDQAEERIVRGLPFDPLANPALMAELEAEDDGVQFSHTLDELLGGLLRAGFAIDDLFEDVNGEGRLAELGIPTMLAVRAHLR